MRLGSKEKKIMKSLVPGEFTPPSVYLESHNGCPSSFKPLNRIVLEKGLAVFRYQTLTPAERLEAYKIHKPGVEAAEFNAALKPTKKGEAIIKALS